MSNSGGTNRASAPEEHERQLAPSEGAFGSLPVPWRRRLCVPFRVCSRKLERDRRHGTRSVRRALGARIEPKPRRPAYSDSPAGVDRP